MNKLLKTLCLAALMATAATTAQAAEAQHTFEVGTRLLCKAKPVAPALLFVFCLS